AGDAFLLKPGEWHRHRPAKSVGWTLLWIGFNGDLPHQWMSSGAYVLTGNKCKLEDSKLFAAQFERLLRTSHRAPTHNSEELSWQAIGLLSHFVADQQSKPVDSESSGDVVSRAIEHIWN